MRAPLIRHLDGLAAIVFAVLGGPLARAGPIHSTRTRRSSCNPTWSPVVARPRTRRRMG